MPSYDYAGNYIPSMNAITLGIYGDGTHDDSNAIITAISNYDALYFPKGTYLFSKTIVVPDGKTIFGEAGTVFQLINAPNLTSYPWRDEDRHRTKYPYFYVGSNCLLEDITIKGESESPLDQGHVGVMLHGSGTTLKNVSTENINYFPSAWRSSDGGYGDNDACPGFGVFVFNASKTVIDGGSFVNNGYQAIGVESSEDTIIRGCYCGAGLRTGIQLHRGAVRTAISECVLVNTGTCVTMHGMPGDVVDGATLTGCIIEASGGFGILTIYGFESGIVISGCKIRSTSSAIIINQLPDQTWVDNRLAAKHVIVSANDIKTSAKGVVINGDNCAVVGNIVEYGTDGIQIAGTSKEISGNLLIGASS